MTVGPINKVAWVRQKKFSFAPVMCTLPLTTGARECVREGQQGIGPSIPLFSSLGLRTRGLQFYTFFGISIGIKRRLIDIAKKIPFSFWKCTVFFAFAFKLCKKCYYDPKTFFLKNINMGTQKTQNFMLISNSLRPAFWNAPTKS